MTTDAQLQRLGLYWTAAKTAIVQRALIALVDEHGTSCEEIEEATRQFATTVDDKAVERLIKSGRNRPHHKPRLKPAHKAQYLAEALIKLIEAVGNPSDALAEHLEQLLSMRSAALQFAEADVKPDPKSRTAQINASAKKVIDLLAFFLNATPQDFIDVRRTFFSKADIEAGVRQLSFNCYRFHTKPAMVVKSYLTVMAPTPQLAACRFVHVFVDPNAQSPRISRGVLVPGRTSVYFLGHMEDESAIKFLATRRLAAPKRTYPGLALSRDEDEDMIASRVLLRRTEAANHTEAGATIQPLKDLRAELGEDLDQLRNRIHFTLEDPLLDADERQVSQAQMVSDVLNFLRKDGAGRFFLNGGEFNPADKSFYTFNAALTLWDSAGDD